MSDLAVDLGVELLIPARQIQVGDTIVGVPVGDEYKGNRPVVIVEHGGGVAGVWIGAERGKWRPADYVFNHGDPVRVIRPTETQEV
jgi:hypothetical protein